MFEAVISRLIVILPIVLVTSVIIFKLVGLLEKTLIGDDEDE